MRRMTQAITVSFLFSPFAVAQDLPGVASHAAPVPDVTPVVNEPMAYDPPTFYPTDGGQPYSSLTSYMKCHDNCKDFWAGYSSERAARAAKLCEECNHGHCQMGHRCSSGCSSAACGTSGGSCDGEARGNAITSNQVLTNRYQHPWASLSRDPGPVNGSLSAPNSDSTIANRVRKLFTSSGQNSLLVSDQPTVQQRGSQMGQADRSEGHLEQQVVSPYMKATTAPQPTNSPPAAQQAAWRSGKPMHFQATLPPTDGKWAR